MIQVLLDGDMFAYRACSACEHDIDWGNSIWTRHVELNEAKTHFENAANMCVEKALEGLGDRGINERYVVVFCFSDSANNFRKKILPTYKANRAGKRKPVAYPALIDWVREEYAGHVVSAPTLEADDCLGIIATTPKKDTVSIIVSGDKDMMSIPCYHYDFLRGTFTYSSEEVADYHFFLQTLMGDTADGYTGCPRIGRVTATKILDKQCDWDAVVKTYAKAGLSEEVALQQARVARILRATDYDRKKQEVRLWKPLD